MSARVIGARAGCARGRDARAAAGAGATAYFPHGYRAWQVAKFKFVGPQSPNYGSQGGFRHHFANDIAFASWGQFADGAVIVDERAHSKLNAQGVWEDAGLAHVAVMRKDPAHEAATGGWYFNVFRDAERHHPGSPARAGQGGVFRRLSREGGGSRFLFSDPRR